MKKLTPPQAQLLEMITPYCSSTAIEYNQLKKIVDIKNFDSSFNALLWKGYIQREPGQGMSNKFKLIRS